MNTVFLVYVVKYLTVAEENRVRAPKTPFRNGSKDGKCVLLKMGRHRFESYLLHMKKELV